MTTWAEVFMEIEKLRAELREYREAVNMEEEKDE